MDAGPFAVFGDFRGLVIDTRIGVQVGSIKHLFEGQGNQMNFG